MKGYLLKEYGSWSVLVIAYLTGLIWAGRASLASLAVFMGLAALVNSKQAFMKWARNKSDGTALIVFFSHISAATAILTAAFGESTISLLPLLAVPGLYFFFNIVFGEHHVLTEVTGFLLLSLAALLAGFTVTDALDYRIYIATAFFFGVGVLKVRVQLRRGAKDRIISALGLGVAAVAYLIAGIPLVLLTPLLDNLAFSIIPYRVKLRTIGWIEVAKGLAFLLLTAVYKFE